MSEPVTLTISRKRTWAVGACLAGAAVLLFLAGSLSGMLYSASQFSFVAQSQLPPDARVPKPSSVAKQKTGAASSPSISASGSAPAPASGAASDVAGSVQATSTAPPFMETAPSAAVSTGGTGMPEQTASTATGAPQGQPAQGTRSGAAGTDAGASLSSVSYAIPLMVQVGSFSVKSHADTLSQSLKDLGYSPVTSLYTDAQSKVWYVVKLGPYTRWSEATQAATRVSLAENVTPRIDSME